MSLNQLKRFKFDFYRDSATGSAVGMEINQDALTNPVHLEYGAYVWLGQDALPPMLLSG